MIVSYRDKRTASFAAGKRIKVFSGIEQAARLKIDRLEAAAALQDLAALPGNRFEALKGDRKGQYGIRVNDQPAFLTRGLHSSQECNLAQEFSPQRVLASEERSGDYVRASMCALRGKGQARARPAQSVAASPLNGANQGSEDKPLFTMHSATW